MKKLYIELADNQIKRTYGLMNRKHLAKDEGMLFKFDKNDILKFWMRETYIPLDIAFINDSGKIIQISSMVPLSTKTIESKDKCLYALEVNKGWFSENNIKENDYIAGYGLKNTKFSQNMTPNLQNPPQEQIQQNDPSVQLNQTNEQILKDADIKGEKLTIIYQTKARSVLPPKTISPPFNFEDDEDGMSDAIVKAWDEQTASWKSFIVDNIISISKEEKQ